MLFYSETFNVSQGIKGALLQWDCSIEWTNEHILSEFAVDVVFAIAAVDKSNIMKLDAIRGGHHHQRLNFKMLLQFNSVFFPHLSLSLSLPP